MHRRRKELKRSWYLNTTNAENDHKKLHKPIRHKLVKNHQESRSKNYEKNSWNRIDLYNTTTPIICVRDFIYSILHLCRNNNVRSKNAYLRIKTVINQND